MVQRELTLLLPPCRSVNLMKWNCHIPGKTNTDWDGGYFPLTMEFLEDYPAKPPKVTPRTAAPKYPDLSSLACMMKKVASANGRWLR